MVDAILRFVCAAAPVDSQYQTQAGHAGAHLEKLSSLRSGWVHEISVSFRIALAACLIALRIRG